MLYRFNTPKSGRFGFPVYNTGTKQIITHVDNAYPVNVLAGEEDVFLVVEALRLTRENFFETVKALRGHLSFEDEATWCSSVLARIVGHLGHKKYAAFEEKIQKEGYVDGFVILVNGETAWISKYDMSQRRFIKKIKV